MSPWKLNEQSLDVGKNGPSVENTPANIFFNLEKRNYVNKTMYEVRTKSGKITKDYREILHEQVCFF